MLMSSQDYRESLRRYRPRVYVDGCAVASVEAGSGRTPTCSTRVTGRSRRRPTSG